MNDSTHRDELRTFLKLASLVELEHFAHIGGHVPSIVWARARNDAEFRRMAREAKPVELTIEGKRRSA